MPGKSSEIYQEGIIIPPVRLYRRGELQADVLRLILANVRTADRAPRRSQCAAGGASASASGASASSPSATARACLPTASMRSSTTPSGACATASPSCRREPTSPQDCLDDDGSSDEPVVIKLRVEVSRDRLILDFAGSSPQRRGNINAVAPMTHSASFFAIKILTDASIPANAGILRPVEIKIPAGLLPRRAAARGRLRRQHRDDAAHRRHGAEGVRAVRARRASPRPARGR